MMTDGRKRERSWLAALAVLAALGLSGEPAAQTPAAPRLEISPLGYRITRTEPVAGNPRAFDVTSTAGICGEAATGVSARLTSASGYFVVLDGGVRFGSVRRTSCLRPIVSQDTFTLRVILPPSRAYSQLSEFVRDLIQGLSWSLTCDRCGSNTPPSANAGEDQTAYVGQTVSLDGTGSTDADGDPLTYSWSLVSRPTGSGAGVTSSSQSVAGLTLDVPGEYVVQLVVDDGTIASTPDLVTVSTLNSRPVSDAGPDQTAYVGAIVRLDGSGSADVDGNSLTYRWLLASVPAGSSATLAASTTATPSFIVDRSGTFVAQLVVSDGIADSDPDTIVISTLNSVPVANAGPALSVRWKSTVRLDGHASTDADGSALAYAWSMLSRPDGSQAALLDAGTPDPSFQADRPGVYVAQLIVNDGAVDSAPATVAVTATNQAPAAADDSTGTTTGTVVVVDVLANDTDADGDPLEVVTISPPAHGIATLISGGIRYTPSGGFNGADSFVYTVTDGADSGEATVTIQVGANGPPVANDDIASGRPEFPFGIQVLGNDSDPDGDALAIASVTQPANGTVAIAGTAVVFTSSPGFVGSTSFSYVVTDGRGGSATATVTVFVVALPGSIARLELAPSAVLLTAVNDPRTLEVRAFDAHGQRILNVPYERLEFTNSNEEQIRVSFGEVEALAIPGSAVVSVRLIEDHAVASAPVLVTAAELTTREEVVVLTDDDIADDPALLGYSDLSDVRYEVRLTRSLEPGSLVLNSGGKAVMGRIVSVDPDAGDGTFRTEVRLVPLTAIFENLTVSSSFTPEQLSPLIQLEAPLMAQHESPFSAERTGDRTTQLATATDAQSSTGGCNLEFSTSTELAGAIAGGVTSSVGFETDLAISEGSLERLKMIASGYLDASVRVNATAGAAVQAQGSCGKTLATIVVPLGGSLSLLIGARVPIGITGSLGLLVQQNLATVEVSQDFQAAMVLGVRYERGQGFLPINSMDIQASPLNTTVDVQASDLRFKGTAFLGGTAGISLGVFGSGFPLFALADLKGGPQFEARFGEPYDVSNDTDYEAGYELKLTGEAGAGADIRGAFESIFGTVPSVFDATFRLSTTLGLSPQKGTVMKADHAEFAAGDVVTFQIEVDPASATFPLLGYNVQEVRVYLRDEASRSARLVASSTPEAPGQTSFELTWTADRDGHATDATSGQDNFFAFVVPELLSTPSSAYPLELGPVRGAAPIEIVPREVVVGTGLTRQFTARVNGQDTADVRWTATGGAISATGLFQAGLIPGTYTVMVARADEPNVTDEATVEVRPRCVPGGETEYCGFSYASQFWPSVAFYSAAVNDSSDWVGLAYNGRVTDLPAGTYAHPRIFWGRSGSFQEISIPNNGGLLFPRDVLNGPQNFELTNSNAFAACTYDGFGLPTPLRAFVSQNGVTRFLDPLPGHQHACAYDVSEDLVVVGYSYDQLGTQHAVRWVNGVAEDLGPGAAIAISSDGKKILVSPSDGRLTFTPTGLAVWENYVTTLLPVGCFGRDINSSGDVVGDCLGVGGVVVQNGVPQPLEHFPFRINDKGDILTLTALWRDGVRHDIHLYNSGAYVDGPPRNVTSLSSTKSLLGGTGVNCIGNNCFSYIFIGYPIELVVP